MSPFIDIPCLRPGFIFTIWRGRNRRAWWGIAAGSLGPPAAPSTCHLWLYKVKYTNCYLTLKWGFQIQSNSSTFLPFCPMNLSVDFRYRMLVLLSLGLLGLFLVCLRTLEKATFRCWSTVFRWKYLLKRYTVYKLTDLASVCWSVAIRG